MDLHPTLILIHVLAALVFVIAHAVSAVAIFQVRGQSDRAVLTATLNRSSKAMIVAYVALVVLLVAGVILGFVGSWWGSLWMWVSLVRRLGDAAVRGDSDERRASRARD
jgi:hypothetical protein